jgi:hypothetical protein
MSSKIHLPPGHEKPAPEQAGVVMDLPDGRQVVYPLVAVATMSPDVIDVIAQRIVQIMTGEDPAQCNTESKEDPSSPPSLTVVK